MVKEILQKSLPLFLFFSFGCGDNSGEESRELVTSTSQTFITIPEVPMATENKSFLEDGDFREIKQNTAIDNLDIDSTSSIATTAEVIVIPSMVPLVATSTLLPPLQKVDVVSDLYQNLSNRIPSKEDPLKVVTIGDSVAYDADLGIRASLESTGVVVVENRSFGGIGLTRKGISSYLEESLEKNPEVLTVMIGGWDLPFALENKNAYKILLEESLEQILGRGTTIIWIGMPPAPLAEGLEEGRILVNSIYKEVADKEKAVLYLETDSILGDSKKLFSRFLPGVDQKIKQVRKIRNGKDDGHLCSAGAALIGEAVFNEIQKMYQLPEPSKNWHMSNWVSDDRYDDPPGACFEFSQD